jgi:hypothetical protein
MYEEALFLPDPFCPLCRNPVRQVAPRLWDCTSRHCNSQFYAGEDRQIAVRDRIPATNHGDFGLRRPTSPGEQERRANRIAALIFALLAAVCFGSSFGFNQPVLALAAFIFLTTAVIVAKET